MSFQENLRHYREQAGYTSADFAVALGLPPSTYAGYEYKGREPKYDLLCKIADILKVSLDDLLGRSSRQRDKILEKEVQGLLQEFYSKNKEPFFIHLCGVNKNKLEITLLLKGTKDSNYCFEDDDQDEGRFIIRRIFIDGNEIRDHINCTKQYTRNKEVIFFILLANTALFHAKDDNLSFLRIVMENFCGRNCNPYSPINRINKNLSFVIDKAYSYLSELDKIARFSKLLTDFRKHHIKHADIVLKAID